MKHACPGCRNVTRDVRCEGGKPVYCTQCGRGYRFIYGFYHRYLYFVFNHPVLVFAFLLVFAVLHAQSFPARIRLPYLVFFSIVYWGALRWVRNSQKYLEPLPTGPHVAAQPPASPATAKTKPTKAKTNRPSFFAIGVFALNLIVFPVALLAGLLSLPSTTGLMLDVVHATHGGRDLAYTLAAWDLDTFRGGLTIYSMIAVVGAIALLAFNIVAMSFVKARGGRGKELVIWSFVFWLISSLLVAAQVVSAAHVLTDWRDQQQAVAAKRPESYVLADDPLYHWTQLHAWRDKAEPGEALLFFHRVLDGTIPADERHAWLSKSIAARLAGDLIRDTNEQWSFVPDAKRDGLIDKMDACCLTIAKLAFDDDRAIARTALGVLRQLTRLQFTLPRTETFIVDHVLDRKQLGSHYLRSRDFNLSFGSGGVLFERVMERLRSPDELREEECQKLGRALSQSFGLTKVSRALEKLFHAPDSTPLLRERILCVATTVNSKSIAPLLQAGYESTEDPALRARLRAAAIRVKAVEAVPLLIDSLDHDKERYGAIASLYYIYRQKPLPRDLSRVRRYYHTRRYARRRYQTARYQRTHENTANHWRALLRREPERFGLAR